MLLLKISKNKFADEQLDGYREFCKINQPALRILITEILEINITDSSMVLSKIDCVEQLFFSTAITQFDSSPHLDKKQGKAG